MATDVKKHTTFAAGEVPKRQVSGGAGLADTVLSINDVVPCANATEQEQIGSGLASTSYPVGPSRPLTTVRADARPLHQVEVSRDGTVFVPTSGVLMFASTSARDTWTSANSGLLSTGDLCVIGALQYRWDGSGWNIFDAIATYTFTQASIADATLTSSMPITSVGAETTDNTFITANTGTALTVKKGRYNVCFLMTVNGAITGRTFAEIAVGSTIVARSNAQNYDDTISVMVPLMIPSDGTVITSRGYKTSGGPTTLSGRLTLHKLA